MDTFVALGTRLATQDYMKKQGRYWLKEYQTLGKTIRPYNNGLSTMLTVGEFIMPFLAPETLGLSLAAEAGLVGLNAGLVAQNETFDIADELMHEIEIEDKAYGERFYKPIYQQNINEMEIIRRKPA